MHNEPMVCFYKVLARLNGASHRQRKITSQSHTASGTLLGP